METIQTKLKSNLKLVYLVILIVIATIVAITAYLLADQIDIPTLSSRYDRVYNEITDSNKKLVELQTQIESTKAKLDSSGSPETDKKIFEELNKLYNDSRAKLEERISLNKELKSLNLNSEINKHADQSIKSDEASIVVLDRELLFIKKQIIRVEYHIVAAKVSNCFTNIDYNVENNIVIGSINGCIEQLKEQQNYFNDIDLKELDIEKGLPKTDEYHIAYKKRWEKSIAVYQALEARDISKSNTLKSELDIQIEQLSVLKVQSEQEINDSFK